MRILHRDARRFFEVDCVKESSTEAFHFLEVSCWDTGWLGDYRPFVYIVKNLVHLVVKKNYVRYAKYNA